MTASRRCITMAFLSLALAAMAMPADARNAQRGAAFTLAPQRPGTVDVYILSFGLWGAQSVFESEAKGASRVLETQLGSPGRSIVAFNTKRQFGATPESLLEAVRTAGRVLDPDEDVLVLVLTSHGGPDGIGMVAGRDRRLLQPQDVGYLLRESRARYRVLIVSACYSGIFARALADARTLVITAAAADRPSFGCRDGATWTYFGDAFFNKAVRADPHLDTAFARAKDLVTAREKSENFDPSNPQIAGGAEVLERLKSATGGAAAR
jgi:Peptidase C13 family